MANIKVTLELDSQGYITAIKMADQQTEKLGRTAATAGATGAAGIGTLTRAMGGLAAAGAAAQVALGPILVVLAGIATAVGAVSGSFTLADDLSDTAKASGFAIDKLIAFRAALAQSGGSADDAGKMITRFNNMLYDSLEMGSKAQKTMLDLGISLDDLKNLSPEDLFQKTVEQLAKIPDEVTRNAIAFDLFGRSAGLIDWDNLAKGTKETTDEQKRQAEVARILGDAYDQMGATFNDFKLALLELMAPFGDLILFLGETADLGWITDTMMIALRASVASLAVVLGGIITIGKSVLIVIRGIGEAIYYTLTGQFEKAKDAGSAAITDLKDDWTGYLSMIQKQGSYILGGTPRSRAPAGDANRTLRPGAGDSAKANREAEAYGRQISQAVELGAAIDAQTKSLSAKYATELKNIGLTQDQIRLNNELTALLEKQGADVAKINGLDKLSQEDKDKYIAEINNKYAQQKQTLEENLALINQANYAEKTRLALIQDQIADRQEELRNQYALADLENQRLVGLGLRTQREGAAVSEMLKLEGDYKSKKETLQQQLSAAIEQIDRDRINRELENLEESYQNNKSYAEKRRKLDEERRQSSSAGFRSVFEGLADSLTPFQVAADATNAVFGNLETAISDFARTGKLNFGDFAKSVIADLIAITLRTIILRTVMAAFGGIFGGGSAPAAAPIPLPAVGGNIRMAAAGGSIRANQKYIVGEKGPELFLPNTSGTMIPNNKLGAMGGATAVTYNINAVDASSFRDLVARDPEFIYSVTQVGARRMPR
jgi:lambda family phage tail tape measure protein